MSGGDARRRRRRLALLIAGSAALLVAVVLVALTAFGGDDGDGAAQVPEAGGLSAEGATPGRGLDPVGLVAAQIEATHPELLDAPVKGPAAPRSVRDLAERLPRSRQLSQLIITGVPGQTIAEMPSLKRRDWAGVVLEHDNYGGPQALVDLTGAITAQAVEERMLPPLIAAAQEGGDRSPFEDLPPRPQPDQAERGVRAVQREARTSGAQLRLLGISLLLAPVADVGSLASPTGARAFSDDPRTVTQMVRAAVAGYDAGGIAVAPGHFPGQGGASRDPQEGAATVGLSRDLLDQRDLAPFRAALGRAPAVLVSNAIYAAFDGVTPAARLRPVVTGLLRDRLRFHGAAIADDLTASAAIDGAAIGVAAVDALLAGCDLLLIPDPDAAEEAYRGLLAATRSGRLPASRVREALQRALQLKVRAGVIERR